MLDAVFARAKEILTDPGHWMAEVPLTSGLRVRIGTRAFRLRGPGPMSVSTTPSVRSRSRGTARRTVAVTSSTDLLRRLLEPQGVLVGFTTPRLEVRRLTMADLDAFHRIWGDPAVIFWGASKDREATRARLEDLIERRLSGIADSGWFAVVQRHDGQLVGDVVLQPAPWDGEHAEVGWHVAKAWQGRGYATEAAVGLLEHSQRHGVDRVYAKILPDNVPSRGVALRIGMQIVGRLDDPHGVHDLWAKSLTEG